MQGMSGYRIFGRGRRHSERSSWRWGAWTLLALLALLMAPPALAAYQPSSICGPLDWPDTHTTPAGSPMAAGGQIEVAVPECDPSGFGLGGDDDSIYVYPTHGTVTFDDFETFTYTNNGDGATTDSMVIYDGDGDYVNVTIHIAAAAAPTITVSPVALPPIEDGVYFSQALTASGGADPYSWSIASGALPPGVTLSGNTISGTPHTDGNYAVSIKVTDSASTSVIKSYNGTIPTPTPTITTTLPDPVRGVPYSVQLQSTGGYAPFTYSSDPAFGLLPTGLTLSSSGLISGTPVGSGSSTFRVVVLDSSYGTKPNSGPFFGVHMLTLTMQDPPPLTIAPASLPAAQVGASFSATVSATDGVAPYSYAITAGALPAGLSLNASSGDIIGTPSAGGSFNFTVEATDSNTTGASTGSRTYTLSVASPSIIIAPATLPDGTAGTPYSQAFSASGGIAPYSYAKTAGSLPAGLTLTAAGTLSGNPSAAGTFNFTIAATDSTTGTGPYSQPRAYTVTIASAVPIAGPVSSTVAYDSGANPITLNLSGGTATSVAVASPPAHGTALVSGTSITYQPDAGYAGPDSFTYTASNSDGTSAPATVSITVSPPTVTLTPAALPEPALNVPYSQSVSASGGATPYSYAITTGSLPAGLSLDAANGAITGTPTATGAYSFAITVTDSSTGSGAPFSAMQNYSGNVSAPTLTLSPATLPAATVGTAVSQTFTTTGGAPPYTYAISAGALPTGVSLASDGTLSGTPTAGGSFNFTIQSTDANTNTGSQVYTWTVSAPTLTVTPATLPNAAAGLAYTQSLATSGGTAPYSYALTTGSLPAGLTLDASGTLSGTPTAAGDFPIVITVTDSSTGSGPYAHNQNYTVHVDPPALTLSPASGNLTAAYGQPFSQSFTAGDGVAPYSYTLTGTLPNGLNWSAASGTISGAATQTGSFPVTVTATGSASGAGAPFNVATNYVIQVGTPSITLTPTSLAAETAGTAYSANVTASGGLGPYTYSVTSGALPAGLTLASDGTLSGTPTAAGAFSITVTASDSHSQTGSRSYGLTIAAPALTLSPGTLPAATAESVYSQTLTASGGVAPYSYAITTGSLPAGLSLNTTTGVVSGTPTVDGNFTFSVTATDSATGAGAPFSVTHGYTLAVQSVNITLTPSSLPSMQVSAPFSQQLTASGGDGNYTYSVTSGSLPAGLSLTTAGLLSGTPNTVSNHTFTVTAEDGYGFTGAQAYSVSVSQPIPVVTDDTASTDANQAVTIAVTANDTGPFTSVTVTHAPTHGSTSVNGLDVVYTPTSNYYGDDSFTYTATGPGGTSAPAKVSVTVAALAVPVTKALKASVLAGEAVTFDATKGATGGPFTTAAISSAPASGTAAVKGTDIVYTAAADASGQVTFAYTLSNAFGASQPARITVTVNPRPVAPSLKAKVLAGQTVQIDLTTKARGGPFTDAAVVSIQPSAAGTAKVHAEGSGYVLDFHAASDFSGQAQLTYTLSNAYATSAPGTIDITVTSRPDPSKDPEVLGILAAQANATRRLARGQINNFQSRLERLHDGKASAFSNHLSFRMAQPRRPLADSWRHERSDWMHAGDRHGPSASPPLRAAPTRDAPAQRDPPLPGGISIWAGGAVNFGRSTPGSSVNGIDFTTSGITVGADRAFGKHFTLGGGVGYGRDITDVGRHGSRSTADSWNVAVYGSYHPQNAWYVDGLLGYQWLSLDARRYLTANGGRVYGERAGTQWFGSLAVGYDHHGDGLLLAPYARLDVAKAQLDAYAEHGDPTYALMYGEQDVDTTTGSLGLRAQWSVKRDYGIWQPSLRAEYRRDFQGSSTVALRYFDLLQGPVYRAQVPEFSRNHVMLGAGIGLQTLHGWSLRFEYRNLMDADTSSNQSILLQAQKSFPP